MTYKTLDQINATTDVSPILVYVNDITNGLGMPLMLAGFFLVVFLGGFFLQLRFRGSVRVDFAFTAAAFASFGLSVLMSSVDGLLNPFYLIITLALGILGVIWMYLTQDS